MSLFKRRRRSGRGLLLPIIIIAALVLALYNSNTKIEADEYEISFASLPAGFDGFRIAQLSDIHGADIAERLIPALRDAQPDIIVITGDLVDASHPPAELRPLIKKLIGVAPVYYVTGNHEWDSPYLGELLALLDEYGVTALQNSFVSLNEGGDSIILAGVDDPNGWADMKTPDELMNEICAQESGAFTVLLSHRPGRVNEFGALGFDLVFSGHVHGGLVRLPVLGGLISPERSFFPQYSKGIYETQGGAVLVQSAGLSGVYGVPRLFNPLHVPVAVLRCK